MDSNDETIKKETVMEKHNPTIVKIKRLEKEVELLLAEYQDTNNNYIRNLTNDLNQQASTDASILESLNKQIIILLSTINSEIKGIYPKGINNQDLVKLNSNTIKTLSEQLKNDQIKLEKMLQNRSDLDGKYNNTTINLKSNKYHYMFYFLLIIIIIVLVYKVISSDDSNISETIILILTIILLFYHIAMGIITKIVGYVYGAGKKVVNDLHL